MKKILLLLLVLVSAVSCRTWYTVSLQPKLSNDFVGKSHNYIVSAMGAPSRTASDGNGGQILIYEKTSALSQEVATNVNIFNGTYTPGTYTTTSTDYVQFYVNNRGNCYKVNTNLTEEYSEFSKGKTIALISCTAGPMLLLLVYGAITQGF